MKKTKPGSVRKEIDYIRCVWGMICTLSSHDKERNNISLFNIIDQFNLPKGYFSEQVKQKEKPLVATLAHELVLLFRRTLSLNIYNEDIPFDIKIKNVDPTGKVIEEMLFQVNFPRAIKRLRFRIPKIGIIATKPGDYIYQIETKLSENLDFKKVLEIPFEVTQTEK